MMPGVVDGRRRVWALGVALVVVAVGVVAEPVGDPAPVRTTALEREQQPRLVVARGNGSSWLQVKDVTTGRLLTEVPAPAGAGEIRDVLAGPDGRFLATAWRDKPCETRFYHFSVTGSGHLQDITPGATEPALVAGMAISPDGRRIAYATAPCEGDLSPEVVVRDGAHRRTWTAGDGKIIGHIVWAQDDRTLGYAISSVDATHIRNVEMRALDTEAPGDDLSRGRLLFRQPDDGNIVTGIQMGMDGRSGFGMAQRGRPPTTILFSFAEGHPMRVTNTIPPSPESETDTLFVVGSTEGSRYACDGGLDAFDRARDGRLDRRMPKRGQCSSAFDTPR